MAKFSAFESLTVAGSSVGLTAGTFANRSLALLTVETAQIRFRFDGATTAPTASVGHILEPGDTLELDSEFQLDNIRFIRTGGTSATLRCTYGS